MPAKLDLTEPLKLHVLQEIKDSTVAYGQDINSNYQIQVNALNVSKANYEECLNNQLIGLLEVIKDSNTPEEQRRWAQDEYDQIRIQIDQNEESLEKKIQDGYQESLDSHEKNHMSFLKAALGVLGCTGIAGSVIYVVKHPKQLTNAIKCLALK